MRIRLWSRTHRVGWPRQPNTGRTRCGRADASTPAPKEQASPPISQVRVPHRQAALKSSSAESRGSPTVKATTSANLSGTDDRGGVPPTMRSENSPMTEAPEDTHVARRSTPCTSPRGAALHRLRRLADAGAVQLRPRRAPRRAHGGGLFDSRPHGRDPWCSDRRRPPLLDYALAGQASRRSRTGQAKYSLLLADDGGVIDDLVVYRTGATTVSWSSRTRATATRSSRHCASAPHPSTVVVDDESDDIALIALQGPKARGDPPQRRRLRHRRASTALTLLPRHHGATSAAHDGASSAAPAYTGEDGFEFFVSAPHRRHRAVGRARSRRVPAPASCPPGSPRATRCAWRRACRSTATSSTRETFPVQAGLGRVVALEQGGRTSSAAPAVDRRSRRRRARARRPRGRRQARRPRRLRRAPTDADDDPVVGEITSGALSPTLGLPDRDGLRRPRRCPSAGTDTRHRRARNPHPRHRRRPAVLHERRH